MGSACLHERHHRTESGSIAYWASAEPDSNKAWLVFLPGLTADYRLFQQQVDHFANRANVLVWDPPSHGASRPFALTWQLDDLARWLHEILQVERASAPVLVGQSMGGYVAQAYLCRYPASAAGFVSIDSCPLDAAYYTRCELFLLRHTTPMYRSIPWPLLRSLGSSGCAQTEYGRSLMREMMQGYDKRSYCALASHGYRALATAVDSATRPDTPCPTLLICGERDVAGSAKRYNRAWSRRTGVPVHWVAGAGHNANADDPRTVNALIEAFVASLA